MSFSSSIVTVASPRPRTGKTLIARLLTDYHLHNARDVTAFDLNEGEDAALTQFLPSQTVGADITGIKGQIALFDKLIVEDGVSKVVDLGSESFENYFKVAREIGCFEEAQQRGIAPVILFVITPDDTSAAAYTRLREQFPSVPVIPVHNELLGTAQHREKYPTPGATQIFHLPMLLPGLRKFIDTPPFSFVDVGTASPQDIPLDIHIELQRWLRKIFLEFRELELQILLADLQSSIHLKV